MTQPLADTPSQHLDITAVSNNKTTLLLISVGIHHPLAEYAIRYASSYLKQEKSNSANINLSVFFYADGATFANALTWQPADRANLTHQWQELAKTYQLDLMVCVSTALARGISDVDNATRHQLTSNNLAHGFRLVGLSELTMKMENCHLLQF